MTLKPNPLEFSAVPVSPSSAEKSRFSTEMENPKREKQRRPSWLNVFFIPLQRAFSVENCLLRCPVKRDPQEDLPGISYHIIHDERRNVLCVVYHQQRSNFRSWLTRIPTSAWDIPHLYIYTEKSNVPYILFLSKTPLWYNFGPRVSTSEMKRTKATNLFPISEPQKMLEKC